MSILSAPGSGGNGGIGASPPEPWFPGRDTSPSDDGTFVLLCELDLDSLPPELAGDILAAACWTTLSGEPCLPESVLADITGIAEWEGGDA
jgi:hypothetical protein